MRRQIEVNQHTQEIIPGRVSMRPELQAIFDQVKRCTSNTTTGSGGLFVGEYMQETSGNHVKVLLTIKSCGFRRIFSNHFSSNPDPHLLLSSSARLLFLPCRILSFIHRHLEENCNDSLQVCLLIWKYRKSHQNGHFRAIGNPENQLLWAASVLKRLQNGIAEISICQKNGNGHLMHAD